VIRNNPALWQDSVMVDIKQSEKAPIKKRMGRRVLIWFCCISGLGLLLPWTITFVFWFPLWITGKYPEGREVIGRWLFADDIGILVFLTLAGAWPFVIYGAIVCVLLWRKSGGSNFMQWMLAGGAIGMSLPLIWLWYEHWEGVASGYMKYWYQDPFGGDWGQGAGIAFVLLLPVMEVVAAICGIISGALLALVLVRKR
jgi:hypothetical protein